MTEGNLHERMLPTRRGSNPQPPDHQSDAHNTETPWPAIPIFNANNADPDQTPHSMFRGVRSESLFANVPFMGR